MDWPTSGQDINKLEYLEHAGDNQHRAYVERLAQHGDGHVAELLAPGGTVDGTGL